MIEIKKFTVPALRYHRGSIYCRRFGHLISYSYLSHVSRFFTFPTSISDFGLYPGMVDKLIHGASKAIERKMQTNKFN